MTTFIGICDWCMEAHAFGSQGARDDWENDHHTRHDRWAEDVEAGAIGGKP